MIDELKRLIDKYIEKLMEFTRASHLKELVPIAELNSIISFCHLFDVLAVEKNGVSVHHCLSLYCVQQNIIH